MLTPRLDLQFYEVDEEGKHVVILGIPAALHTPVQFSGSEYIRVGSLEKPLKAYPEKERELWQVLNVSRFEQGIAAVGIEADQVLRLLDYTEYFDLIEHPLPSNREGILSRLSSDGVIVAGLQGWSVTNLGAILFAKSLNDFGSLSRKGLRVIQYAGRNRISTLREAPGNKGYAVGFVSNDVLTNPSLRARFEISEGNSAQASRIIAETVEAGLVKPANPDNKSRKLMQYHPFWA